MASLPYPLNCLYNHGRVGMAGMPYHSVCTIFVPFISVDSCLAKRWPFCGFQNLKPVGFCAFCAFCGNYKTTVRNECPLFRTVLWKLQTKELQDNICYQSKFPMNQKLTLLPSSNEKRR